MNRKMTENQNTVILGSIRVTDEEVAELSRGMVVVQIPTADITKIELTCAIGAERPLPQFIFGLILTMPGIYSLRLIWLWLFFGGPLFLDLTAWFLLFIPIGLWVVITAFRKRVLLHVHTKVDKRKLVFKGKHTKEEIRNFTKKIKKELNCPVMDLLPN